MTEHASPDETLLNMPPFRSVRTFVAAARHQNFTRAAEALCVTQAAVSRQIRELESFLDTQLFVRDGKSVTLTPAGTIFFDAVQLSTTNIAQATRRIRKKTPGPSKNTITVCCSTAFCSLWMAPRLKYFLNSNPDIDVRLIATHDFLTLEPGPKPDIIISKLPDLGADYTSSPLFHDIIYPVASPEYLARHPDITDQTSLARADLLNLSPYGRSQIAEHVDWQVWFAQHGIGYDAADADNAAHFSCNDYRTLVQLAIEGHGVVLGWDHLVRPLLNEYRLIRPTPDQLVFENTFHYLAYRQEHGENEGVLRFSQWVTDTLGLRSSE